MVWVEFQANYPSGELSSESIAALFDKMGDFQIYKVTKNTIYLQFYYIDKSVISDKSIEGVIAYLALNADALHIQKVSTYAAAPKFIAHNHLE